MKTDLAPEARELEASVDRVLTRAGGVRLVEQAQGDDPDEVAARIATLLDGLGVWELTPRRTQLDAEAAAAVCRAAGRVALPYPVAERLAGDPDGGIDAVAVVSVAAPRIGCCAPGLRWAVSDGAGAHAPVTGVGRRLGTKLGALACEVETGPWQGGDDLAPLALTLPCWTLLGMCEAAFAQTRRHLLDRHQFGKPLAGFQALQFRMADTASALQAFTELAKYTCWAVATGQPGRLADALALRLAALETAESLFRTCHQMHGAVGFCDELSLSWLSRYSQPVRRLPWGRSETEARLLRAVETSAFDGLFGGADELDVALVS